MSHASTRPMPASLHMWYGSGCISYHGRAGSPSRTVVTGGVVVDARVGCCCSVVCALGGHIGRSKVLLLQWAKQYRSV
jgi:hypothetical protein